MIFDSKSNQESPTIQVPVYLNVYNFWSCFNKVCEPIGIGVYHTGVQFYDDEYMFFGFDGDETGVGYIEPFEAAYEFKEQILLGYSSLTFFEFDEKVLDPLRVEFTGINIKNLGNKYDLLGNNCNHFARRLTKELKVDEKFPKKIFRITDFCNLFRCCIPQCILNGRLDWFDWSSTEKEGEGYHELEESVKEEFDMKILQPEEKHRSPIFKDIILKQRYDEQNPPIEFEQKAQESSRFTYTEPNYDTLKHTTLPKGTVPHSENAHERASMNELPNVSPRSLGKEPIQLVESKLTQPSVHKKYPNEHASIFAEKNTYQNYQS